MKKALFLGAAIALVLGLLGCKDEGVSYKNEVCKADMTIFGGVEPKCKDGQIFLFQPNRWGNAQIPIIVATYFCDFNAPIVHNESSVSCVYKRRYDAKIADANASKQHFA